MVRKMLLALAVGAAILAVGCGAENIGENNSKNNNKSAVEDNNKGNEKEEEPKETDLKIASGSVAVTQVFDKLDVDLVGVPTTKSVLPERYEGVQDIGQAFTPDFEILASLEPDLLVFDKNFEDDLKPQAEQYGMDTFFFDTATYGGFVDSIDELGEMVNRDEEADEVIEELNASVDSVMEKAKAKGESEPTVAIIFGTSESYMLATEQSYLGDLVKTIGGKNIASDFEGAMAPYLNFSMEQVVAINPDYVLRFSHGNIEEAQKAFEKEFAENPAWQALDAVKEGRIYDLDSAIFGVTANLKVVDAIEELGNILYGE